MAITLMIFEVKEDDEEELLFLANKGDEGKILWYLDSSAINLMIGNY